MFNGDDAGKTIPRRPPSIFVPAVHLNGGVGQLVALTYKSIMLVLILDEDVHVDARLLESLRDSCNAASGDGLSLAELQPLIVPQYKEIMEQEDEYRFVYYNHTNHALRLSNQASMSRSLLRTTGVTSLGPKAAEKPLLTPLHATLTDPKLKCREVSWKSADRGWICAKRLILGIFDVLLAGSATRTPLLQALNSDLSNNSLHSANETETSSGLCKVFVSGIEDCPAPSPKIASC
eukprot:s294_g13.t1